MFADLQSGGCHPFHMPCGVFLDEAERAESRCIRCVMRFGAGPATSVLDENCKTEEFENLHVVGTSFFPSIGAASPPLTAMANSDPRRDHLLERMT